MEIRVILMLRTGRKFYECQWRDPVTGLKKTRSTKKRNRDQALRFAAKFEAELNEGKRPVPVTTWKEFRQQFEAAVFPGQSARTVETTKSTLSAIEEIINPGKVGIFDEHVIRRFQKGIRARGVAEFTVKRHSAEMRKILRWAHRQRLLMTVPNIRMPTPHGSKGRPITDDEFKRILAAISVTLQPHQVESWTFLVEGLWHSGLRLGEALLLDWEDDSNLCVDLSGPRPMFRIRAHADKGRKSRMLPMAPEFANFLENVPESERHGLVFRPVPMDGTSRPQQWWISKMISRFGKNAEVKVSGSEKRLKFASAHDFRRAFGFRWANRVLPPTLMELMRHESITTTEEFYLGRNASAAAEVAWTAFEKTLANTDANRDHSEASGTEEKTDLAK